MSHVAGAERGFTIAVATAQQIILMVNAAGKMVVADGTVAANADLVTGTLMTETFAADKHAAVRLRNTGGTDRCMIANNPVTDLTVPLKLTADGKGDPGGAVGTLKFGMPLHAAKVGEWCEFRWINVIPST